MTQHECSGPHDVHRLAAQTRSLQRQVRVLTVALLLCVAVAVGGFTRPLSQDEPGELTVTKLTLLDSSGFPCVMLGTERAEGEDLDDAFLTFLRPSGMAATLHTGRGSPFFVLQGSGTRDAGRWLGRVKLGADATFGPHVILQGTNADAVGDGKSASRRTDLRVPWGEHGHCVELTIDDEAAWTAP